MGAYFWFHVLLLLLLFISLGTRRNGTCLLNRVLLLANGRKMIENGGHDS